jgi:prolyl 4-hydroxylase
LKEYERMYHEASNDVSKYLENPINAYLIVKRLTTDWKVVENAMVENAGQGN